MIPLILKCLKESGSEGQKCSIGVPKAGFGASQPQGIGNPIDLVFGSIRMGD